jgi:NAD(P)H-dependent FMN reductase
MSSSTPLKIGFLLGSIRQGRQTDVVVNALKKTLQKRNSAHKFFTVDPLEAKYRWLATVELPLPYQKPPRPDAQELSKQLREQDLLFIVAGEYNHAPSATILSLLSNFHHETWRGKVAALVNYGGQIAGGGRSAYVLRNVAAELGLFVVPKTFFLQAPWSAFNDKGEFVEPIKQKFMDELVEESESVARQFLKK